MNSTVGRGEVIGVSAASLRRALVVRPFLLTVAVRSDFDYHIYGSPDQFSASLGRIHCGDRKRGVACSLSIGVKAPLVKPPTASCIE